MSLVFAFEYYDVSSDVGGFKHSGRKPVSIYQIGFGCYLFFELVVFGIVT
jgi:hypothetical protein